MKSVKITYLITDLELGGAQTLLLNLLPHLKKGGFSLSVIVLYGGQSSFAGQIRDLGVPVFDLEMRSKWRLDAAIRLFQLLRRQRPHVLHGSLFHAVIFSRLVGRLAGVPAIISWRLSVELGSPMRELANRLTSFLDASVVASSEAVRREEIKRAHVSPSKVVNIPNFVDLCPFDQPNHLLQHVTRLETRARVRAALGIPAEPFLALMLGRLHPLKGIPYLLDAMSHILEPEPDTYLLLVGSGDAETQLKQQVLELGIGERVRFAGFRDDIPDILAASDLLVLPSLWEGLPMVVLEAMAARLPVVATDVGGTAEAVVDEVTGLLVPPADHEALAKAILSLISDPHLRRQMGEAGRERVKRHFSAAAAAERLSRLYLEILEDGAPGSER